MNKLYYTISFYSIAIACVWIFMKIANLYINVWGENQKLAPLFRSKTLFFVQINMKMFVLICYVVCL